VGRWEGGKGKRSQNGGWSQPYTEWKGSWVSVNYVYPFLVVRTETVDLADIKLKWESVKVEDMVDIPKCFSDWDCTAAPHLQDRFLVQDGHLSPQKFGFSSSQGGCRIVVSLPAED